MSGVQFLMGEPVPWFEDGNCIMCGFSHRYQWPDGSDLDHHKASYVACINMLLPELVEAWKELGAMKDSNA